MEPSPPRWDRLGLLFRKAEMDSPRESYSSSPPLDDCMLPLLLPESIVSITLFKTEKHTLISFTPPPKTRILCEIKTSFDGCTWKTRRREIKEGTSVAEGREGRS